MNGLALRMLDANANRAREALRVMEDYARFGLNDDELCRELKELRHELTAATGGLLAEALVQRDTPGDVGTENKTAAELRREDLASVVTAAGKRLGEALRVIEEVLKTEDAAAANQVEKIRYRFYELERRIGGTLHGGKRFAAVRLYVLITESVCRRTWLETAQAAIAGGADALQLREKSLDGGELLRRAKTLADLCRGHGVLFIVNDRADIALLSGADGVHVGQSDLPAAQARKILGPGKIVGVSTHEIAQAKAAVRNGADYIGAGPIFRSDTKPREFVAGLAYARQVAREISIPAVAIAGINAENVDQVTGCGIKAVAVTAAVSACEDVAGAARALKAKLGG